MKSTNRPWAILARKVILARRVKIEGQTVVLVMNDVDEARGLYNEIAYRQSLYGRIGYTSPNRDVETEAFTRMPENGPDQGAG